MEKKVAKSINFKHRPGLSINSTDEAPSVEHVRDKKKNTLRNVCIGHHKCDCKKCSVTKLQLLKLKLSFTNVELHFFFEAGF